MKENKEMLKSVAFESFLRHGDIRKLQVQLSFIENIK